MLATVSFALMMPDSPTRVAPYTPKATRGSPSREGIVGAARP
jgi:hypothetical protein